MPIDITTVFNVRTKNNIEKFNIDVSKYDDIKELRKYIQILQNKERQKSVREKRALALQSEEQPVLEHFNKHVRNSVEKYNININDFKTKGELLKHLKNLATQKYIEKNRDKINEYYRDKAREQKLRKKLGFEMPTN